MPVTLNSTHDPDRRSWVVSAEHADTDFPLQNLPFGVIRIKGAGESHIGVAIGECVLDLNAAAKAELLPDSVRPACEQPSLNELMAAGETVWTSVRQAISALLGADTCPPRERSRVTACLLPMTEVEMLLPAQIGDYTDFYASIYHATNVGRLFRPDQPLISNYKWMPTAYHGRASSIVVSGAGVRRPLGQRRPTHGDTPEFGPAQQLDYELELGAFVGPGNQHGQPIPISAAASHLFGVVLLNDWSARDIQAWEYQPLGPFLAKSFATTISPWVVTMEALAPFRAPLVRPSTDPAPLRHLSDRHDADAGGLDVVIDAYISTAQSRLGAASPERISQSNPRCLYWTLAQLVAHHASNGCNLRAGDLLGTGTISGSEPSSWASLLELTFGGREPMRFRSGENRGYLEDGDEVIFHGRAIRPGFRSIGFGHCRGMVLPALEHA